MYICISHIHKCTKEGTGGAACSRVNKLHQKQSFLSAWIKDEGWQHAGLVWIQRTQRNRSWKDKHYCCTWSIQRLTLTVARATQEYQWWHSIIREMKTVFYLTFHVTASLRQSDAGVFSVGLESVCSRLFTWRRTLTRRVTTARCVDGSYSSVNEAALVCSASI